MVGALLQMLGVLGACQTSAGHTFDAPQDDGSSKQRVTMEALLSRNPQAASGVLWYESSTLIARLSRSGAESGSIHTISLDGTIGESLSTAEHFGVSPDGQLMLEHTRDGWIVRELGTRQSRHMVGEARVESGLSYCCRPVWTQTGNLVAFAEYDRSSRTTADEAKVTAEGVSVLEVRPPRSAGWRSRITILDVQKGSVLARLWVEEPVVGMAWENEESLLLVTSTLTSGQSLTSLFRVETASQAKHLIYRSAGRFQSMVPAVKPDQSAVALALDIDNRTWADFSSIVLVDLQSGKETHRLTTDLPIRGRDYVWSPDGRMIYARVAAGGLEQIYAIPVRGQPRKLTNGCRRHFDMQLSPDGGSLGYQTMDGYGRNDIRTLDLDTGEEQVVLVLDDPSEEFELGLWRQVRWESTDGVRPYGYLITPPGFDATSAYPMIVDVHGGGEGSSLYLSGPLMGGVLPGPLEWHMWAALGYIVFVPDYRSTGDYGPEVIKKRYMIGQPAAVKDVEDILSGTLSVTSRKFVNSGRVAIIGHSAGGQRAYLLLTQTRIFSAAILYEPTSPDPVSTFIHLTTGNNTGRYPSGILRQIFGGHLSEVPERYKRNYMLDTYRIRSPTLILLGNESLGGVSHMPTEVLYSVLTEQDVPVRMLKLSEEGHVYSRSSSVGLAFREISTWLDTHLQ